MGTFCATLRLRQVIYSPVSCMIIVCRHFQRASLFVIPICSSPSGLLSLSLSLYRHDCLLVNGDEERTTCNIQEIKDLPRDNLTIWHMSQA